MTPPASITDRTVSEGLGLWEPKRALTLEAAREHTQRIKVLRQVLVGFSVLLVLILIWQFLSDRGGLDPVDDPTESVKMVNPRYSGRTSDGLPFYLTSDTATRRLVDRNTVALVKPVLEFIRDEGAQSSFVVAERGNYNDMQKILDLRSDVNLKTDDGYVCDTTHARIFNRDKRIEGDEPIDCAGSFGTVTGQTYAIEDSYKTFIFKDGMTALIEQEDAASEEEADTFGFGGDGPIDVIAQKGTYYGTRTDLRGDVRVEQDGTVLTSDEMDIYRTRKEGSQEGSLKLGAIQRIEAQGNFHYMTSENDIRGERGVYERDKKIMTVTGNVVVVQPSGNRVTAEKLVYNTTNGTIQFSGKCLGRNCDGAGRVGITLPGSGN